MKPAAKKQYLLTPYLRTSFFYLLIFLSLRCSPIQKKGYLLTLAPDAKEYEIYQIKDKNSFSLFADRKGKYNKKIPLEPGYYLIIVDCSSKQVVITANQTTTIKTVELEFKAPHPLKNDDIFSIRCTRNKRLKWHQNLKNQLNLMVFPGKHKLLINSSLFHIDLKEEKEKYIQKLSAIKIASTLKRKTIFLPSFFVKPSRESLSMIQSQKINRWLFLLPGEYTISLNGTKKTTYLKPQSSLIIHSAYIKFSPKNFSQQPYIDIWKSPFFFKINDQKLPPAQTYYPILPGTINISLVKANKSYRLTLKEHEKYVLDLPQVSVNQGCGPWEWECIGNKEVLFFADKEISPFYIGTTDIALFYLAKNQSYTIALRSSHGIRHKIFANKKTSHIDIGRATFIPKPQLKPHHYSDLIRLEAADLQLSGYSENLAIDKSSNLDLFAGKYKLVSFTSSYNHDNPRSKKEKTIYIKKHQHHYIEFPYFVHLKAYKKAQQNYLKSKRKLSRLNAYNKFVDSRVLL
jgi:hypothetical protein